MAKQVYGKKPLSVPDQITLLQSRGLEVSDRPKAERYLNNISYYRLSGYMYPFLADPALHTFKQGTTFEDVVNLYKADRELRLLAFSALEKIEVAVRAQLISRYAVSSSDPFWYEKTSFFKNAETHNKLMKTIAESVNRSTDTFMSHFHNTYSNPHPPVWITFEVLQMGQLSMLYNNLATSPNKKAVAHYFGVTETVFTSWLHSLVYVRNICAHHARLWNKELRVPVKLPKTPMRQWPGVSIPEKAAWKVYPAFAVIVYLLNIINPAHHFKQKLKDIVAKYPVMSLPAMGFPQGWENDPFWV